MLLDNTGYGVAVDIGTTTVAMSLVSLSDNSETATVNFINPQREAALGSDVLSRMKNAADPRIARRMRGLLTDALSDGIDRLCGMAKLNGRSGCQVTDRNAACGSNGDSAVSGSGLKALKDPVIGSLPMVVAGNATMLHIFSGLDTASMLTAPFAPADISLRHEIMRRDDPAKEDGTAPAGKEAGSGAEGFPVTVFPCVSAFVGGDIVAGIYALGLLQKEEPVLFLDLGTNGEMALAVGGKLYVTSVAAGPAFEGGNISIGMAAVKGAVTRVFIRSGFSRVETVGGVPAKGICGSGLFDAVAGMYQDGVIDRHGTLSERYIEDGFPVYIRDAAHRLLLKQEDIRAFQTAKAAVAAGAEALLRAGGVPAEKVKEVYIAGSFGEYLDLASAKTVGLLPEGLFDRARSVGNTSLLGAKKLLLHPEDEDVVREIAASAEPLDLAGDAFFKDAFIERMEL